MKSRKILVPIDLKNRDKQINDFLYPSMDDDKISLKQLKNDKEWKCGMVVLKGGGVTENDLFAAIVDSGKKIKSVETMIATLESFLEQLPNFKIGDIVGIQGSDTASGFKLIKLEQPKRRVNSRLP